MKKICIVILFCVAATAQTSDLAKETKRNALATTVLREFSEMSLELADLHDQEVNSIVRKHLLIIQTYVRQMRALDEAQK